MRFYYPLRLTENKLASLHLTPEAAFDAGDYLYVARFGDNQPELKGLALIMLGNRAGGEKVLDHHDIRTGRASLYRAFAAWQAGDATEARRWIAEAHRAGADTAKLTAFERLLARDRFRVVLHADFSTDEVMDFYRDLPAIDVVQTRMVGRETGVPLRFSQKLSEVVPSGLPVDLVLIDDLKMLPLGVAELGAPVVVSVHDHEWYYDLLDSVMPEVDCLTVNSSLEGLELGRAFGTDAFSQCHVMPFMPPEIKGMAARFVETRQRHIDLLFTGGIIHDFYRDKRQRILGLAELDSDLNIALIEGHLDKGEYFRLLHSSRFSAVSVRLANYGSTRCVDIVCQGTIALVERECGFPYMFSEIFPCFQTYRNEFVQADILAHLRNYPALIAAMIPKAAQLEREMADLFCTGRERAARYIRFLLFVTQVERLGRRKPAVRPPRHLIPFHFAEVFSSLPEQLDALLDQWDTNKAGDTVATWQRRATAMAVKTGPDRGPVLTEVENGLAHHPSSLALLYMRAMLRRRLGEDSAASEDLRAIVDGPLTLEGNETFPWDLDPLHGCYWPMDARIRSRCRGLAPLVPEIQVWRSFACSHLADIAVNAGLAVLAEDSGEESLDSLTRRLEAIAALNRAAVWAQEGRTLFAANDQALRSLLRTAYALYSFFSLIPWAEVFLNLFTDSLATDPLIFHDFAAMAVDMLHHQSRNKEAETLVDRYRQFHARALLPDHSFTLYPETEALLDLYKLPHGHLRKELARRAGIKKLLQHAKTLGQKDIVR